MASCASARLAGVFVVAISSLAAVMAVCVALEEIAQGVECASLWARLPRGVKKLLWSLFCFHKSQRFCSFVRADFDAHALGWHVGVRVSSGARVSTAVAVTTRPAADTRSVRIDRTTSD